jgi:hypothetical protein
MTGVLLHDATHTYLLVVTSSFLRFRTSFLYANDRCENATEKVIFVDLKVSFNRYLSNDCALRQVQVDHSYSVLNTTDFNTNGVFNKSIRETIKEEGTSF